MPWVRIDDAFTDHPKVREAGPLAIAMQVAGLCYCNRYLTDGFVPRTVVPSLLNLEGIGMRMWSGELVGGGEDANWSLVVEDLIDAGLWEEVKGGYLIHDYLEYQPSKADVLAEREQKKLAGQRGGLASAKARAQAPAQAEPQQVLERNASTTVSEAQAELNPVPNPVPVPGPVPQDEIRTGANAPAPKARTRKPRMTTPKAETSEPKDERKSALFSAFVRGMRWDASRLSTNDRGQTNYAIKALPDDATPAEVDLAFDIWPGKFKDCAVTPPALAKHFSTLMAEARRKGLGPRIEQPFYSPIDDPPEDPEPLPEPAPVAVNGRVPLEPVDNGWSTYNPHGGYEANRRRVNA